MRRDLAKRLECVVFRRFSFLFLESFRLDFVFIRRLFSQLNQETENPKRRNTDEIQTVRAVRLRFYQATDLSSLITYSLSVILFRFKSGAPQFSFPLLSHESGTRRERLSRHFHEFRRQTAASSQRLASRPSASSSGQSR